MKDLILQALNLIGLAYWVEIETKIPHCNYYFGPFSTQAEAINAKTGYLEDLTVEGAQEIKVEIKRCKPAILTIFDEAGEEFRPFKQMLPVNS